MNKISLVKIWALSKKNIQLYIKKGPVLIFGLMFPFFMVLSWVLGREISPYQVFVGIISMTAFFTSTAISPVVLPIETREKSLERLLSAPISIQNILLGIIIASTLYSLIITSIITLSFTIIFWIPFSSIWAIILLYFGIFLMAILGSLLGVLVAAKPADMTSEIMLLGNLPFFAILLSFISPITFLTDLSRYCVYGTSYFPFLIDILILMGWIFILFLLNLFFHKKTMPKRLSTS
ncbi:MAG: hypothetical protein ACTSPH_09235 [Promethearchaeota archaeon]